MAINVYQVGDLCRVDITFKDVNGDFVDPTANSLFVTNSSGITTEYVYGTDPEITRTGVGVFYVIVELTSGGKWLYRWFSTGAGQAAEEALLMVEPSDFEVPAP